MDTLINCTCKIDLVSLYFRLLWYHSILRGSIDQNTLKQTKFENKTVKSTQPSLVLIGLHDFLIFSNRTVHAWSVEVGNICSFSQSFFVRVGSQISPRRAKKNSNIPSPGRTRSVKSPPHALPPRRRPYINRCIILPLLTWNQMLCLVNCFTKDFYVLFKHRTMLVGLFWVVVNAFIHSSPHEYS